MEFARKDLADIQLVRENDLYTLTLLRSRGPAFEGGRIGLTGSRRV